MRYLILLLVLATPRAMAMTMEEAYRAALEKSESVKQSGEQVVQADARVARLRGGLFPDISFNASYLIQPEVDPAFSAFSPPRQTTAVLTARQPIFRGLREFAGLRQQGRLKSASQARHMLAIQQLYQEVATNYLTVLNFEQDLKNLEEQVGIYERRVTELRGRTKRGESSTSELLSSQATLNSLQAEQRLVQGQLFAARETFHSLTGRDRNEKLTDPALIPSSRKVVADSLEEYLAHIEKRPDIRAVAETREAADEGVAIARGAHFPVIDAVGNYYIKRPGFLKELNWDVSLQLTFPIFSGGATQAQVREAASQNRESELELARVRRLADAEIRSLHQNLKARLEHLAFLRESTGLAEKNVSISQSEFRRGLIRSIDVQAALGEYRNIRRAMDQAHFAAQLDLLRLEVASGLKPEGLNSGL